MSVNRPLKNGTAHPPLTTDNIDPSTASRSVHSDLNVIDPSSSTDKKEDNELKTLLASDDNLTSAENIEIESNGIVQHLPTANSVDDQDKVGSSIDKGKEDESNLLLDKGWAWLVVLGCFLAHVITGGFERSDGVLFLEFTDRYAASAQVTAWPGALCSSIRLLMGPVASAVCNRYSVRTSVLVGTIIFAIGVIISGFAPNIPYLFFSYGLLQGVGRGFCYAPGLIIVGQYFNRRRGLAVGLGSAGVGAGTFLFPPFVEWLFDNLGFTGAFLILGGIALNMAICAFLYRPMFVHRNIVMGCRQKLLNTLEGETGVPLLKEKDELYSSSNDKNVEFSSQVPAVQDTKNDLKQKFGPDVTANVEPLRPTKESCWRSVLRTCFPVEKQKTSTKKRKLIEWTLLKDVPFLFYCFSICLFTVAFKSAFTFLPALAESKGISKQNAAYLLSIAGVVDTIGRILAGLVLDIQCIQPYRPVAYNGVIFLIVFLSFMSPFMTSFWEFAVLFGLYGCLTGTYVSQKSVILVDILGQEKLSSSFGLLILFQGIGTAIGPPMSGLLKDVFGRFNEAFYLGGAAMAIAGGLMVISNISRIVILKHKTAEKQEKLAVASA